MDDILSDSSPCINADTLACITGALWAKRGERGILHETRNECKARDEGRRKISVCYQSTHCSGSSHVHYMNVAFQLVIDDALIWHVCLKQNIRHAFMFFWRRCSRNLAFISKCSRNKRKIKEMFLKNVLLKDILGLLPIRLGKFLIY